MKKLLTFFLLSFCVPAFGASQVTATFIVTNTPANNDTFTVNGSVRTWKTTVVTPATQVVIGASIGANATNAYLQVSKYTFTTMTLTRSGTNGWVLKGAPDQAVTASLSGTWGTVALSTNTLTQGKPVVAPASSYITQSDATNIIAQLALDLGTYSTNALANGVKLLEGVVQTNQTQTVNGDKTFTGANVYSNASQVISGGSVTNLAIKAATMAFDNTNRNGIEFYSSTPARVTTIAADANGIPTLYGTALTAIPTNEFGAYTPSGGNLLTRNAGDTYYGRLASANSWTLDNTFTSITNSTIGTTTITNGIFYGTVGLLSGGYLNGSGTTNLTTTNTTFTAANNVSGDIAFTRANHTALANGNNAAIDFGATAFPKIKIGPTAAFNLNGIAGGRDGRMLVIYNSTAQNMTIANDSGVDPTPANRIYTLTGADVTTTGTAAVTLIYDSEASRWIMVSIRD